MGDDEFEVVDAAMRSAYQEIEIELDRHGNCQMEQDLTAAENDIDALESAVSDLDLQMDRQLQSQLDQDLYAAEWNIAELQNNGGTKSNVSSTIFANVTGATVSECYAAKRSGIVNFTVWFEKTANKVTFSLPSGLRCMDGTCFLVRSMSTGLMYHAQMTAAGLSVTSEVPNNATYRMVGTYPYYS